MNNKNKQYRIEKGLLLFTQPRSPYFYGKFRINGKYKTQSFAPISDLNEAKKDYMNGKTKLLINKIILKIQIKLSPIEMNMYLSKN